MEDFRDRLKIYIQGTAFISLFRDPLYDDFFINSQFKEKLQIFPSPYYS